MKVGSPYMSAPVQKSPDEKLHDVSEMYEKHFLREMLKSMRSTVHEGGFIQSNQAEKIFREQLDDQYVDKWSDRGGIGLSGMIYKQLVEKFGQQLGITQAVAKPQGPIPLTAKDQFTGTTYQNPGSKDKLAIKFERNTNATNPAVAGASLPTIHAPWDGVLLNKIALNPNENLLEIGHDNGLKSQLIFNGQLDKLSPGQSLQGGEVLGVLSPNAKSVFWNVEEARPLNPQVSAE